MKRYSSLNTQIGTLSETFNCDLPMEPGDALIPWRRRNDLVARPQGQVWVLKDPVAQRYFQLGSEAYFVWSLLNGSSTASDVCRAFSERYAPRSLTTEELRRFLGQLAGQGLLWGDAAGAGGLRLEKPRGSGLRPRTFSRFAFAEWIPIAR
ncbi:MAG: hypothetical protein B7Z55_18655 [Planctomycetales bacterium 12-60-4]|nr:MAG: hypothetical protein B7Z55_18655 [Planctomycetales bacterium 12-60-4]